MGFIPVVGETPPSANFSVVPGYPAEMTLLWPDGESVPSWTLEVEGTAVLTSTAGQVMTVALSAEQTTVLVGRPWVLVDVDRRVRMGGQIVRWADPGVAPASSYTVSTGGTRVTVAFAAAGPPGPASTVPGPPGPAGPPLVPTGSVADEASLPGSGVAGDFYITLDNGHGWTWVSGAWQDTGPFVGPAGDPGDPADLIPLLPEVVAGPGIFLDESVPGDLGIGVLACDVQEFTSSGTWTKPANATLLLVEVIGGGSGGGSGRKGAEGSDRFGGSGGAGGTSAFALVPAASAGSTVAVTIGAGGAGGASRTTDSTSGVNGGSGGASSFGTLVIAQAQNPGEGGGTTAVPGAASLGSSFLAGAGGTNAVVQTLFTGSGGHGHTGGGAAGGWRSTANSNALAAGTGGSNPAVAGGAGGAPGTAGTAGANGRGGSGGGGGNVGAAGGAGGARGGGGGGGGAGINGSPGTPSGAGGAGGAGYVRVTSFR